MLVFFLSTICLQCLCVKLNNKTQIKNTQRQLTVRHDSSGRGKGKGTRIWESRWIEMVTVNRGKASSETNGKDIRRRETMSEEREGEWEWETERENETETESESKNERMRQRLRDRKWEMKEWDRASRSTKHSIHNSVVYHLIMTHRSHQREEEGEKRERRGGEGGKTQQDSTEQEEQVLERETEERQREKRKTIQR